MKLKQITMHDAVAEAAMGANDTYIMIRMTSDTPVELLALADGFLISKQDTEPQAVPVNDVPKSPAGFAYLKATAEEPEEEPKEDKPAQKKGKYDVGKICALRRASWTVAKIADEIGCSEQTVRNILKREGMV